MRIAAAYRKAPSLAAETGLAISIGAPSPTAPLPGSLLATTGLGDDHHVAMALKERGVLLDGTLRKLSDGCCLAGIGARDPLGDVEAVKRRLRGGGCRLLILASYYPAKGVLDRGALGVGLGLWEIWDVVDMAEAVLLLAAHCGPGIYEEPGLTAACLGLGSCEAEALVGRGGVKAALRCRPVRRGG